MKADDLKRMLEVAIDDTVDPVTALDLFNSALRDLATVARLATKTILPFVKTDRTKALPADMVEIRSVTVDFNSGSSYALSELTAGYGMTIFENQSIDWVKDLYDDGTLTVKHYRFPILLTNLAQIPEIPEIFHDALVHYATRELLDADLENSLKADVKYQRTKQQYDNFTLHRGTTGQPALPDSRPPWMRR